MCVLVTRLCKYCINYEHSCRRPGRLRVFHTRSSSRARSTTSPSGKVGRCKINDWLKREKWLLAQQDPDLVVCVSVVQDQQRPGVKIKLDHLTNLLTVSGANSLSVKGINPAPHIHEHLRYTIMATALRTPSRITTSRLSTLR